MSATIADCIKAKRTQSSNALQVAELCIAASEATGEPVSVANYLGGRNYACSGALRAVDKVRVLHITFSCAKRLHFESCGRR